MSLKDRLTRLTGDAATPSSTGSKEERISELRRKIDAVMNRREAPFRQGCRRRGGT